MISGLEHVAELIRRETGMAMGRSRLPALAVVVKRVAPGLDGATVARVAANDRGASGMLARLVDGVVVNETFFFRHREELDVIDWPGLAASALADGRARVRVWSAACASGEEPYTLAMMASKAFARTTPPVSILASDISRLVLDRARGGIYRQRSVRMMSSSVRAKHLIELGEGYGVKPELRELVRFRHHNLVSDPAPPAGEGPFDLIVCRNVLIYFEPEVATQVLASLHTALAPGGVLLLGTADRLCGRAVAGRAPRVHTPRPRADAGRSGPTASPRRVTTVAPPARPAPPAAPSLASARKAADCGRLDQALTITGAILAADPLRTEAYYVRGVVELAGGGAAAAVTALRSALCLEPQFALAAFQLARAHDCLDQPKLAGRAYERVLHILADSRAGKPGMDEGANPDYLEAACRARLQALRPSAAVPAPLA